MSTTPPTRPEKQPYARPVLKTYGALAQLTQLKGMTGANSDGALANNNKTI
jgi:hypothetical protein